MSTARVAEPVNGDAAWSFEVTATEAGPLLMQVLVDGVSLDASPFTIHVMSKVSGKLAPYIIVVIVIALLVMSGLVALVVRFLSPLCSTHACTLAGTDDVPDTDLRTPCLLLSCGTVLSWCPLLSSCSRCVAMPRAVARSKQTLA